MIGKMKQKMPDPDGSKLADTVIAEYYQRSNAQTIQLCGFDESLSFWIYNFSIYGICMMELSG